jgi:hypothetical protein
MTTGEQTTAPLADVVPTILDTIKSKTAQTVIKTDETNA